MQEEKLLTHIHSNVFMRDRPAIIFHFLKIVLTVSCMLVKCKIYEDFSARSTTMLFSFKDGDAKGHSRDKIHFVLYSLFYGEPVQMLNKRFGVFCSTRFKDELISRVLYFAG